MNEQIAEFNIDNSVKNRLDKTLVQVMPDLSRVRIQSLIKKGLVSIDGEVESKPSFEIEGKVLVKVILPIPEPTDIIPESIPLDIIFENGNLLVINKPAGMVAHPSAGHGSGTLVNAVLGYAPDIKGIGGQERPGIVHRLDKDTSGIILVAKDDKTHRWIQDQFKLRKVEKWYLALVDGHPKTDSGRIEASIGRDPKHRKKMSIVSKNKGREAISNFRVVESFNEHCLLEVHPITGRTHQIRLHCSLIGCPIVGDVIYGKKKPTMKINRHFLHAWKLRITLFDNEIKEFMTELPDDLEKILSNLRIAN
ncbi:RluA family pseudouridine synthase [Chloroflexota bacterium]